MEDAQYDREVQIDDFATDPDPTHLIVERQINVKQHMAPRMYACVFH